MRLKTGVVRFLAAVGVAVAVAACASPTAAAYVAERRAEYRVVSGYVIALENLSNPRVQKLRDGVAYTVTEKGASLVMEFRRGRRESYELAPGDVFVQARPLSHLLEPVRKP